MGGFSIRNVSFQHSNSSNSLEIAPGEHLKGTPSKSANGFVSIFDASHSIGTILHMQSAHIHAKKGGKISEKIDFK